MDRCMPDTLSLFICLLFHPSSYHLPNKPMRKRKFLVTVPFFAIRCWLSRVWQSSRCHVRWWCGRELFRGRSFFGCGYLKNTSPWFFIRKQGQSVSVAISGCYGAGPHPERPIWTSHLQIGFLWTWLWVCSEPFLLEEHLYKPLLSTFTSVLCKLRDRQVPFEESPTQYQGARAGGTPL